MAESTPTPKKKSNVTSTVERMKAANQAKAAPGEQKIADAQSKYDATSSRGKRGSRNKRAAGSALSAEKAAQEKLMQRGNDTMEGVEFAAGVIGEEGLGRLGDDAEVTDALARKKDIADQGLSRQELAAERAQATRSIDSSTQTASRGLQAKLAKMGVKGSVAGQQLVQAEMQGAQQKADLSQNLFLKSEQVKREGLQDYSQSLGNMKTFDLGQSAKEKDIMIQSGLGFAQMGSSERTSKFAAEQSRIAQIASAKASKPKKSSVVCTELYKQGRISKDVWDLNIEFGKNLDIHVYKGYLKWGLPMVSFMQKSELNSKIIASFMTPCANGVANKGGIFGKFMFKAACTLNSIIGSFLRYKDSKNPLALKITK